MHSRLVAALAVLALVATGCIGATDRSVFEAEVRSRGGGVSRSELATALETVAVETNGSMTLVRWISVTPIYDEVTLAVQDPNNPAIVDRHRVVAGKLVKVSPVQVLESQDTRSFLARDVPLDRLEVMVDRALAEFGGEAWVEHYRFELSPPGDGAGLRLTVAVASARALGVVLVDVDRDAYSVQRL